MSTLPTCKNDQRERRRREIVEAASRLFAELGYSACEMERVAEQVGIAKGTLYLYFPGKQELFFACVDWAMKQLQATVHAESDDAADNFDRIAKAIRAYLKFFEDHPHYVELLIQERAIFRDRKRPTYFEYRDVARDHWRGVYEQLIRGGRLRDDLRVEDILDTVGHLVYGTMFTNHFIGRPGTRDGQHAAMFDILMRGLISDDERRQRTAGGPPRRQSAP